MSGITGTTRLFAILGDPVAPLRSPALFNAAFARMGLNAAFVPFQVPAGTLSACWPGIAGLANLDGLVVTMPHKEAVVPLLQSLGPTASLTGTVNTVRRRREGGWEGEMFDGEGFRDGLERAGHAPRGRRILQVGCGAAGRAIAFALANAGAARLSLRDVEMGRAAQLAARLSREWPALSVSIDSGGTAGHEILVNATPMGLCPDDPLPLDPAGIEPHQVVVDVIPNPEVTPLIQAARRIGSPTVTGRAMHEGQARLAAAYLGIEGWDG